MTSTAIVTVRQYYGVDHDRVSVHSLHDSPADAEGALRDLLAEPHRLDHGQASGRFLCVPVLDDRTCHQAWADSLDWAGCPHPEPRDGSDDDDQNFDWAAQRAIDQGGPLPVVSQAGDLYLVQMPR